MGVLKIGSSASFDSFDFHLLFHFSSKHLFLMFFLLVSRLFQLNLSGMILFKLNHFATVLLTILHLFIFLLLQLQLKCITIKPALLLLFLLILILSSKKWIPIIKAFIDKTLNLFISFFVIISKHLFVCFLPQLIGWTIICYISKGWCLIIESRAGRIWFESVIVGRCIETVFGLLFLFLLIFNCFF